MDGVSFLFCLQRCVVLEAKGVHVQSMMSLLLLAEQVRLLLQQEALSADVRDALDHIVSPPPTHWTPRQQAPLRPRSGTMWSPGPRLWKVVRSMTG